MKRIITMLCLIALITGCDKDDPVQEGITTITGNTYWAEQGLNYSGDNIFLVYAFKSGDTIAIEERVDSRDGSVARTYTGKYTYDHPELQLEIFYSEECPDCSNKFTAKVADNRKSFNYTIWDMVSSKNKNLNFVIF